MSEHYDNSATINVQLISIHAPLAGRDLHGLRLLLGRDISIHAPHAGRDTNPNKPGTGNTDFNPRAPCGARLNMTCVAEGIETISIHAPRAGRDLLSMLLSRSRSKFQSTRPMRGATIDGVLAVAQQANFNPRAPCGARRASVSAPSSASIPFQSTRPMRGAT